MSDENFETKAIRTQSERSPHREHCAPIYMTSSFVFDDAEQARAMFADELPGNIYTRFSNPNNNEFIEKLCDMENCEDGIATASGMAAMFVSLAGLLSVGDHVLASRSLFGSTHQILTQILPRWGINHTYVDVKSTMEEWEAAITPETKMVFIETPSNPALDLIDLEALGKLCKKHDILFAVDNCFATPYLQRPADFGADIVAHSATKFIDGQGRCIAGAILGTKEVIQQLRFFARHSGPSLSPMNAWLLSKSLETLSVRMERHCENAHKLAKYLEASAHIDMVKYPFLESHPQHELAKKQMSLGGGLVTFELKGGVERGRRFLNSMKMISFTANLGDTRSIATHPASTTHSKLSEQDRLDVGITPGLVRISVGLEHIDDIIVDVEQALIASQL
jgi:O-succinylhomoserine sulfhydrylase